MAFAGLLIHSITIYNPVAGTTDRYGNETLAFDAGTVVEGRVEPYLNLALRAREQLVDRDTRENWFRVFLLPTVTISGLSELDWEGHRLKVDGEPSMVHDGVGDHHWQLIAKEYKG